MDPISLSHHRFEKIRGTSQEKILVYAKRCYLDFQNDTIYDYWVNKKHDKNWVRSITRPWYDLIHSCSVPSGLISEDAFNLRINKKTSPTKDHCYRPQFVYRFMLDNREEFLNEEYFTSYFIMCCTTILVTGKQNDLLSFKGTDNRHEELKILIPTNNQYSSCGIPLFNLSSDSSWNKKTITPANNIIPTPSALLEYEHQYI